MFNLFGLMLVSDHQEKCSKLQDKLAELQTIVIHRDLEIKNIKKSANFHTEVIEKLQDHMNEKDKLNAKLENAIKTLKDDVHSARNSMVGFEHRLQNAVEGLTPLQIKILREKVAGNYIYTVTRKEIYEFGEKTSVIVNIPIDSKDCDYNAKMAAIKMLGLTRENIKEFTAERWSI